MISNLTNIGPLLSPADYEQYVRAADSLESVVHRYGAEFSVPDYPCMMEYRNEGLLTGSIGFTRHTYQHPVLREMVDKVVAMLMPMFPESSPPNPLRIHVIRTTGDIPVHKDEANRMTAINIGLQNSAGAVTRIGHPGCTWETFDHMNEPVLLQDGNCYVLNTNQWHSVTATNGHPRYLITYSAGTPYAAFLQGLRL